MSSEAQIAANRRNAQVSTGPSSSTGKAVSRFNNLKTGIYAKVTVIPGEDASELEQLTHDYHLQFQPANPEQRYLVDSVVHDEWLLRRYRKVESSLWEYALSSADTQSTGEAYACQLKVFNSLHRRIASVERSYNNTLRQLHQLQADVQSAAENSAEPSRAPAPQMASVLHSPQPGAPQAPALPATTPAIRPAPENLALRL